MAYSGSTVAVSLSFSYMALFQYFDKSFESCCNLPLLYLCHASCFSSCVLIFLSFIFCILMTILQQHYSGYYYFVYYYFACLFVLRNALTKSACSVGFLFILHLTCCLSCLMFSIAAFTSSFISLRFLPYILPLSCIPSCLDICIAF